MGSPKLIFIGGRLKYARRRRAMSSSRPSLRLRLSPLVARPRLKVSLKGDALRICGGEVVAARPPRRSMPGFPPPVRVTSMSSRFRRTNARLVRHSLYKIRVQGGAKVSIPRGEKFGDAEALLGSARCPWTRSSFVHFVG